MPTYRNDSNKGVPIGGGVIMPGGQAELAYYYPNYDKSGLELVSNTPPVQSPYLINRIVTDAEIAPVPYAPRISISMLALSDAVVYFADDTNGIELPQGVSYDESDIPWKYIGKIRVEGRVQIVVKDLVKMQRRWDVNGV